MGLRRIGQVVKRTGVQTSARTASSVGGTNEGKLFGSERGYGVIERGLNKLGRLYQNNAAYFNFALHAEKDTRNDLDHISAGNESWMTEGGNRLTHDKFCKWWTVEGLPGAGKANFAEQFANVTGTRNFGTGHLFWELERIKTVTEQMGKYNSWKMMIEEGCHFLAMRNVDLNDFYANPGDAIHSCRMQDHMKLQRHIHSMDALRHLLTTAQGVVTNRTFHSDYCYAYAMYKMGYMSKNFYEMRYAVSQAAADGSNTATDMTPNVSFFIDISPEEAFESIKARGNESEIQTCNLEFLKYVEEAYKTIWGEDMNTKGCTVFGYSKDYDMNDISDFVHSAEEEDLRHQYSRWSHSNERQTGVNNRSQLFGPDSAIIDGLAPYNYNRYRKSDNQLVALLRFGSQSGNHYEHVLQHDLSRGPAYSYDILWTFHPWDSLAESYSHIENLQMMTQPMEYEIYDEVRTFMPYKHHPDWRPKENDWFGHGHASRFDILFGSGSKYVGDENLQYKVWQRTL